MTIHKTREPFVRLKRLSILGLRVSALIEIAIALVVLVAADNAWFGGSHYWYVNPHPYWFVVLFIASKYGTREAMLAVMACSVALLAGDIPSQSINQDGYAYTLFILRQPLLWLVSAVVFGELRQMHINERDRLEIALQESEAREQHIATSYIQVRDIKDKLELQLVGQFRSAIAVYRAAKEMEQLDLHHIFHGMESLVVSTLHPQAFSIYRLQPNGLEVSMMHGWPEGNQYAHHFDVGTPLYDAIVMRQEVLCVAKAEHENILSHQGLLAGPLLDRETGEVVGMLKIEQMNFIDLHVGSIETFSTLCEWAGLAIVNARKYEDARAESVINPDHNLLTQNYFTRHIDYVVSLAKRVGFDVSMLIIRLNDADTLDGTMRTAVARALSKAADKVLRNVDFAFDHQESGDEYAIVLPITSHEGAQRVLEKIRTELATHITDLHTNVGFSFTIQSLYVHAK